MKNTFDDQERYKMVEIDGEMYRIEKFTARVGLKLARMLLAKIAPIIPLLGNEEEQDEPNEVNDNKLYAAVAAALDSLNDKDVDYLMNTCLRAVSKMLPAGPTAIIDANGFYGIPEVEYDLGLTIRLIVEAIKWGASDFFGEKGLSLKTLFQTGK